MTLLNASYSPTRELYGEYNAAFEKYWKAKISARQYLHELFRHIPVLDTSARAATTTFAQHGLGDVLRVQSQKRRRRPRQRTFAAAAAEHKELGGAREDARIRRAQMSVRTPSQAFRSVARASICSRDSARMR